MAKRPFGGGRPAGQRQAHAGRHANPAPSSFGASEQHQPRASGIGAPSAHGGLYAPVVIGEPIFEFEPKPPAPRFYCPDTIFDGWSTGHVTVRMASVRGYAHRYSGAPRQDAAAVACDVASGVVVMAVADGVSSSPQSHIGAAVACQAAIDMILHQLTVGRGGMDWAAVMRAAAAALTARVRGLLRDPRPNHEAVEKLLATTLVAGYITPAPQGPVASIVQVGDSSGWVLQEGRYRSVLEQKHRPHAEIISSAVTPLPHIPRRITPVSVVLSPGTVLLIGTDGFGDPLGDGDGKVGQLFTAHLQTPPSPVEFAHFLDFSRETFDDDRALVVVWPRGEVG
jgi:hypothetical protein